MNSDGEDVSRFDRARAWAMKLWPFVASAAAVAAVLAATVISVRAIRDRDRLADLAVDVRAIATEAGKASQANRAILAELAPCDPGDPPDTPACLRKARSDATIADAIKAIGNAQALQLDTHDATAHADHDALRRLLAARAAPLRPRTPITTAGAPAPAPAAPVPSPAPVTTTTAPVTTTTTAAPAPRAPATTTTTRCARLPNRRCRP